MVEKLALLILFIILSSCSQKYSECPSKGELYRDVGELLKQGKREEVIQRFLPSAKEGVPSSQHFLGTMLWHSSPEEAFKWNMLSAKQGCIEGVIAVAEAYKTGHGVQKDSSNAFNWFYKAAKSGDKASAKIISVMYDNGEGVKKDNEKSYYWFNQSNKTN